jgi:hypothetical protein
LFSSGRNIPKPEWKLYCSSTSALTKKSIEDNFIKTNLSKCFISISTIGVAVAQSRRGQHPQIISVAHRPAHARMMGGLANQFNLCFTSALTCFLSPGERILAITVPAIRLTVRQIQSREFSKRRRTILLLLGEKAGMREVVNHLKSECRRGNLSR